MKRVAYIIILFVSCYTAVSAQQYPGKVALPAALISPASISLPSPVPSSPQRTFSPASFGKYHFKLASALQRPAPPVMTPPVQLSPDFYYIHCYGFFCKMEWLTQEKLHIPLSFRLGSYNYERHLEGEE